LKKSEFILEEDITVTRGYGSSKIDSDKLKKTKGYISTSLDKAISRGYTTVEGKDIRIKVRKGTKIMYLRNYSKYPNHMEVLIPPEYYIPEVKLKMK